MYSKIVLFGNYHALEAWCIEHRADFEGWNKSRTKIWKDDSEVLLVSAGHAGCEQQIRGRIYDDIEIQGPYSEHMVRAIDTARMCLRRKVAS